MMREYERNRSCSIQSLKGLSIVGKSCAIFVSDVCYKVAKINSGILFILAIGL